MRARTAVLSIVVFLSTVSLLANHINIDGSLDATMRRGETKAFNWDSRRP